MKSFSLVAFGACVLALLAPRAAAEEAWSGHVDAARRVKVRMNTEAYSGPLEVEEVLKSSGTVARGDPLVRFARDRFEEELRGAVEAHREARLRVELARRERAILLERDRSELERTERAKALADQALRVFAETDGPRMLRAAELDIEGREQGLENQKEELSQLEKMYRDTRLASETKEIVLERARRGVKLAEAWLEIARRDARRVKEVDHPNRRRDVEDGARYAAERLAHAREGAQIEEARKGAEVESLEHALRAAEEREGRLQADRERLLLRAPADGVLSRIELAPGDSVERRHVLAEVLALDHMVLRGDAPAAGLASCKAGAHVAVRFPGGPGSGEIGGTIVDVGAIGAEGKDGVRFPFTVELEETPAWLRIGLKGEVRAGGGPAEPTVRPMDPASEPSQKRAAEVLMNAPAPASFDKARDRLPSAQGPERTREAAAVEPRPPAPRPAEAYRLGLEFLLKDQNPDGSWGSFASARPYEIMLGTEASLRAFGDATTALCMLALAGPSRSQPKARDALDRALAHLLAAPPHGRATGEVFYDTWAHAYVLTALAVLHRDGRFAKRRDEMAGVIRREIDALSVRQGAEGGFAYYDFGTGGETPSGHMSTSFLTSVVLLALKEAREAGFRVDPDVVADGVRSVERQRLPSGAFIYGTYAELRPGVLFNRVNGSLGRSQVCNLALAELGRDITTEELAAGVERLRSAHHFIEMGKSRPYPHEAWYYTAGYYFLFGHYYAARVIEHLDPKARAGYRAWLAGTLARVQDPDGSWFDFPLYGYHKQYGTAFAMLALESCLGAPPAPVAREAASARAPELE